MNGKRLICVLFVVFSLLGLCVGAECKVIYVSAATGKDYNNGLSWATAKASVASGAGSAANGDEVWVAKGVYIGSVGVPSGVALYGGFAGTETSRDQRDWKANTVVLDGKGAGPVVGCLSPSTAVESRVDGFVIKNGRSNNYAGGIHCAAARMVICNNVISGNSSYSCGAGIHVALGKAVIENNVISGNGSRFGAGVFCDRSEVTLVGNTIINNSCLGLYCSGTGTYWVSNHIVAFNARGIVAASCQPVLRNNCVYNPNGADYSGVTAGVGDISVDPKIADAQYGGFHIASDSPCIDAGWNAPAGIGGLDIDGQPRVQPGDGIVDIGADEFGGVVPAIEPVVVRVKPDGDDANDGSSWALAKKTVQAGINAAAANVGEVWVAKGLYNERIALKQFAFVYGGFAGSEDARDARDWNASKTVLNGGAAGSVVTAVGFGQRTAVIDGFTITNGSAPSGAGIYCENAGPVISNNLIKGNTATYSGIESGNGGGACVYGSALLRGNVIVGNTAKYGGGVCIGSATLVDNNTIIGNHAYHGGGVYCFDSLSRMTNNLISGNESSWNGGGIFATANCLIAGNTIRSNTAVDSGGGIYSTDGNSSWGQLLEILNNLVAGNNAPYGAGICCRKNNSYYGARIIGNTVIGHLGAGIDCQGNGSYVLSNNIAAFNATGILGVYPATTLSNNCVYNPGGTNYVGVAAGTMDISADPKIIDWQRGGFHIAPDSPCRDAGSNDAVTAGSVDIDGQLRIQPAAGNVDIGADESDGSVPVVEPAAVRVKPDGDDANDGSSWALAKKTVQAGIDAGVAYAREVWVAKGTYAERITLKPGAFVYGGFAGTEDSRDARSWQVNKTTLDGGAGGSVVTATKIAPQMAAIDGFTITNGKAENGGGIYCSEAGPVIAHNVITANNSTGSSTGAIHCSLSSAIITGNVLSMNVRSAIRCTGASSPVISGNTIVGHADSAVTWGESATPRIVNNIIAFNLFGVTANDKNAVIRNNCFFNENVDRLPDPASNIFADPMLAGWPLGDFHIQPDSPCRDAGWNEAPGAMGADIDAQARVQPAGGSVDIGVDESDGTVWTVQGMIVRVSPEGDDANDGSSWALAKKTVQAGMDAAMLVGGEVWVKAGTYTERIKPYAPASAPAAPYGCKPYASLYGGFAGTETTRYERDWKANQTILDGDKLGSVVTTYNTNRWVAAIDGFTIRNGNATSGGGINCGSPTVIRNNVITDNAAGQASTSCGGGIYCGRSYIGSAYPRSTIIRDNVIVGNRAYLGGAVGCSYQAAELLNNRIARNASTFGAVYCDRMLSIMPSTLVSNNAILSNESGGIYIGQPTPGSGWTGTVNVCGNTIVDNKGVAVQSLVSTITLVMSNNILAYNGAGLDLSSAATPVTLRNNCFYNPGGKELRYATAGVGDIFVDPKLADGWWAGDFKVHIQPSSPCRDAGWNGAVGMSGVDIDGQARLQPVDGTVDIGADESDDTVWPAVARRVVYVKADGDDANDGFSWALAKKTVQAGIDAVAVGGGDVWVKAGTYKERVSLKRGVCLYGGFVGTESALSERPAFPRPRIDSAATVLDGEKKGSVVTFNGTGYFCGLDGFTLINGQGSLDARTSTSFFYKCGGGVGCVDSSPAISNNTITACRAMYGSGVFVAGSGARIVGNSIVSNGYLSDTWGSGIWACDGGKLLISRNVISDITANIDGGIYISRYGGVEISGNLIADCKGGGLRLRDTSDAMVTGNTIVGNVGGYPGGITAQGCTGLIANNIVAFNSAGMGVDGMGVGRRNNCVYNPGGTNYIANPAGVDDISVDPMFVDRAHGNYHLKAGSPCIDAGWNDAPGLTDRDMDWQKRVHNQTVDMGADEWWLALPGVKVMADATAVELSGAIVTASFDGFFYIESEDRSCGIRVEKSGHSIKIGDRVDISGALGTNSDGERCIAATVVSANGGGKIAPLALPNSGLGGAESAGQGAVWGWCTVKVPDDGLQKVWQPVSGLNTTGLLVRVWGKVTHIGSGFFYMDDGSRMGDDSGFKGVKVYGSVPADSVGKMATVSGIASCERLVRDPVRVILTRTDGDVVVVD